jgi:hypothetical protein
VHEAMLIRRWYAPGHSSTRRHTYNENFSNCAFRVQVLSFNEFRMLGQKSTDSACCSQISLDSSIFRLRSQIVRVGTATCTKQLADGQILSVGSKRLRLSTPGTALYPRKLRRSLGPIPISRHPRYDAIRLGRSTITLSVCRNPALRAARRST